LESQNEGNFRKEAKIGSLARLDGPGIVARYDSKDLGRVVLGD
jgi:hypothetical protein